MNKKMVLGGFVGAVIIVAALGVYLIVPMPISGGYMAITTVTDQFFVGRAYRTPFSEFIELREPFLLQAITDAETNTATPQLVDLSVDSYWMPKKVFIHIDNIVSKGEVSPESLIATKIAEYKAATK